MKCGTADDTAHLGLRQLLGALSTPRRDGGVSQAEVTLASLWSTNWRGERPRQGSQSESSGTRRN